MLNSLFSFTISMNFSAYSGSFLFLWYTTENDLFHSLVLFLNAYISPLLISFSKSLKEATVTHPSLITACLMTSGELASQVAFIFNLCFSRYFSKSYLVPLPGSLRTKLTSFKSANVMCSLP